MKKESDFDRFREKKRRQALAHARKVRRNGKYLFERVFQHAAQNPLAYFAVGLLVVLILVLSIVFTWYTVVRMRGSFLWLFICPWLWILWFFVIVCIVALTGQLLDYSFGKNDFTY